MASSPAGGSATGSDGRRHRGMLASYYGLAATSPTDSPENASGSEVRSDAVAVKASESLDPCDLDSSAFSPDLYLNKIKKEKSLTELMDTEHEMVRREF